VPQPRPQAVRREAAATTAAATTAAATTAAAPIRMGRLVVAAATLRLAIAMVAGRARGAPAATGAAVLAAAAAGRLGLVPEARGLEEDEEREQRRECS
jgi:hypothetical protein